jgi:protein-L-isoaspartate(D-aspartate) O-methyltransferase
MASMRPIGGALVLLLALGCPKRDDTQPSPAVAPAPAPMGDGALATAAPPPAAARPPSTAASERRNERETLVSHLRQDGIADERVLSAMAKVPRHAFVPESEKARAYVNEPLPIGHGQTISQPIVVAAMTEAARPRTTDKCLEIGTGSGYQAAILAELCKKVYSIEYVEPLAQTAEQSLRRAGYDAERVMLRAGDGYRGWPDAAPFDVVLVTAAPETVPRPLLDQVAPGGRLVIPVGPQRGAQQLELYVRSGVPDAGFTRKTLMAVRFVPFVGEAETRRP